MGGAAGIGGVSSLTSVISDSVVITIEAMDAAFSIAARVTLPGP